MQFVDTLGCEHSIIFQILNRYLWKMWEAGKLNMLVQGKNFVVSIKIHHHIAYLGLNVPIVDPSIKVDRLQILVDYFLDRKNNNDWYAMRFFFCEALNFVNVIGQIFFIDFFLGGEFTTYGRDVISISEMPSGDRMDPMSRVFPKVNNYYLLSVVNVNILPFADAQTSKVKRSHKYLETCSKVTKCTFHKYGASGTVQTIDGLCILPLNIINEKIYVFIWFWFIFLAIISAIHVRITFTRNCQYSQQSFM